jgi:hypothetical protein
VSESWTNENGVIFGHEDGECIVVAEVKPDGEPLTTFDMSNARLIAAAPDLLAALESLLDDHTGGTWHLKAEHEDVRKARIAIKKARGEQ